MVDSFRELEVYREAFALVKRVYQLREHLPEGQRYVLSSQPQRAASSIPLNIAEGFARQKSRRDFENFLSTATGSANEVLVLLDLSLSLEYVSENSISDLRENYERLARRLGAFRRSVRERLEK